MKMKRTKKALSLVLCMVLIVAMALFTTGCNDKAAKESTAAVEKAETAKAETAKVETAKAETTKVETVIALGEGSKVFDFSVVESDGTTAWFEIHTDAEKVGEALMELELLEGDEGPYGLYVKTVNGITADYDKDKVYWAFYVNNEYGTSGVDMTEIEEGAVYSFRIAK